MKRSINTDDENRRLMKDMEKELGEGNKAEIFQNWLSMRSPLIGWRTQGLPQVRCDCRQMLAGIPDTVRLSFPLYNSRLTGMGIPVSCEVDIYGALSEFIGTS